MPGHVALESFERTENKLAFTFSYNGRDFPMYYRYDDSVNLTELEKRYGQEFMETIYFYIMAFEGNKLASLKPDTIDWGQFSHLHTAKFESLWKVVFHNVWAQWRYENNEPYYEGPKFTLQPNQHANQPTTIIPPSDIETLLFCGSGKDSLTCLTLLQNGNIPFDTLTYSSSIYGDAKAQHRQADKIIDVANPRNRRKQWVEDSFMDSDVLQDPDVEAKTLTAAETPSSIFGSLPYVLANNYHYIALGHERSANIGQVFWEKMGEDVNHQWGKSFEAEKLLNSYIQDNLIANIQYFSLLQPIHDVLIFSLLNSATEAIRESNSCNEDVTGCEKCPKCAYVDLGFKAYLPGEAIEGKTRTNLFNTKENQYTYRQLLGLENQLPFECIGQRDEVDLAFALCVAKGYSGVAIDAYKASGLPPLNPQEIVRKYLTVHDDHGIPSYIAERILPQMIKAAHQARALVVDKLGPGFASDMPAISGLEE